jgi:hypothetical protein
MRKHLVEIQIVTVLAVIPLGCSGETAGAQLASGAGAEGYGGSQATEAGGHQANTGGASRDASIASSIGGTAVTDACQQAGGTLCTRLAFMPCPTGFEPVTGINDLCTDQGWCCANAPPSPCSSSTSYNCLLGTSCPGPAWGESSDDLACEPGRVCCENRIN